MAWDWVVLMKVLQVGLEHCVAVRRVGLWLRWPEREDVVPLRPTLFLRRFAAQAPAWAHLCDVSVR